VNMSNVATVQSSRVVVEVLRTLFADTDHPLAETEHIRIELTQNADNKQDVCLVVLFNHRSAKQVPYLIDTAQTLLFDMTFRQWAHLIMNEIRSHLYVTSQVSVIAHGDETGRVWCWIQRSQPKLADDDGENSEIWLDNVWHFQSD